MPEAVLCVDMICAIFFFFPFRRVNSLGGNNADASKSAETNSLFVSSTDYRYPFSQLQVPLEGFSALQGISGSQRFQIHKAYGSPDHLPSAHTW